MRKALLYEQFNPLIKIYRDCLEDYGFEVFATKYFERALEFFKESRVDLIWVKYEAVKSHSALSGVELLKELQKIQIYKDSCKIVSAVDLYKTGEIDLLKLGVNSILRIPATKSAIVTVISSCDAKANTTTHPTPSSSGLTR
jgi:DNA-binding response OmpR family regulator